MKQPQFHMVGAVVLSVILAAGCSDPTLPLKERIEEVETENAALAARVARGEEEHDALESELEMGRHANDLLLVELEGLQAQLGERNRRLEERSAMVALSSQHLAAVRGHLEDMKATYGGQSNLIERAKAYTTALKQELAARDRQLREKERAIRDQQEELEERDEEIERLKRARINPPGKQKGLAGPTPVGGGSIDRKVHRLGE